jgi:hypothetical protein
MLGALVAIVGCTTVTGVGDLYTTAWDGGADAAESGNANLPTDPESPGPGKEVEDTGVDADPGRDAGKPSDAGVDASPSRVFVLSRTVRGDLNGVGEADQLCTASARDADLDGEWVAWLSSGARTARDRVTSPGPFVLVDGTRVSATKAQLTGGTLEHAIDLDERRKPVSNDTTVWTGTRADGTSSGFGETCMDWNPSTPSIAQGRTGSVRATDGGWTQGALAQCSNLARVYCFETFGTRPQP